MQANETSCISRCLIHEGGYTNDPQDPGGPTNWGITIWDARLYWKKSATAADVRAMPKSVAITIYEKKYWDALQCDDLPSGVDDSIFDYGVNSGIARSGKVLRRVVGVITDDWRVTPKVLDQVRKRNPADLVNAINDERMRFLRSLRTFPHFGGGWTRRVTEVRAFDLGLAKKQPVTLPQVSAEVQAAGRGKLPEPTLLKVTKKAAVPAVVGGAGAWGWVSQHPLETACVFMGGMILVGGVGMYLTDRYQKQQAEPMSDTPLVPVAA